MTQQQHNTPKEEGRVKVIVIASDKGGVGKSTFAKLVMHTAMARGYRVSIAELDASNPDMAEHGRVLECPTISVSSMVSGKQTALSPTVLERFKDELWGLVDSVTGDHIVIVNTPLAALAALELVGDDIFFEGGVDGNVEVFGVYVCWFKTFLGHVGGETLFSPLGSEHFVVVAPEHLGITVNRIEELYQDIGHTSIQMAEVLPISMEKYVAPATADFGIASDVPPRGQRSVLRWWLKQRGEIEKVFGIKDLRTQDAVQAVSSEASAEAGHKSSDTTDEAMSS